MDISVFYTVILLALLVTDCEGSGVRLGLSEGPSNEAALVGDTVVLTCESDAPVPVVRIFWYEFAYSPFGSIISDNLGITSHPQRDRYRIIQTRPTQFDLQISDVRLTDGGRYMCGDSQDNFPNHYYGQAELVIIESDPMCTTTVHESGVVLEGQGYISQCSVAFQGNLVPQMVWYGPEPFSQEAHSNENQVWVFMSFIATRSHNSQSFHCLTNFTELLDQPPEIASNAPSYRHEYRLPQVAVYWSPTNASIIPNKASYEIGETVTCWVDANPEATYQWTNMRNLVTFPPGPTFVVTPDMAGLSQTMRCNMRNTILQTNYSQDAFFVVLVPAPTVSTMSTSTGSTTPVPDTALCDDVTGRWQSTNPTATLCIFVLPPRGRVYGIVRNGTDPYFVEIQGQTKVDDYSHVGFGSIWPLDALVAGFVGECHKCRGNEVLLMDGVWRSKSASPSCGTSAGVNAANIYIFTRSGPPCGSDGETFRVHKPGHITKKIGLKLTDE